MKILRIDEKWSVVYDDTNNDRPHHWLRYDEPGGHWDHSNAVTAMFYALLEKSGAHPR